MKIKRDYKNFLIVFIFLINQRFSSFPGMEWGEFIRAIRKQKLKKTSEQLAKAIGVAPQTVSRWENGHLIPEHENVLKILALAKIEFTKCLRLPEDWLKDSSDEDRMRRIAREVFEEKTHSPPSKKSG